jgi:hypothetical protein
VLREIEQYVPVTTQSVRHPIFIGSVNASRKPTRGATDPDQALAGG